jgi:hypothetical protein
MGLFGKSKKAADGQQPEAEPGVQAQDMGSAAAADASLADAAPVGTGAVSGEAPGAQTPQAFQAAPQTQQPFQSVQAQQPPAQEEPQVSHRTREQSLSELAVAREQLMAKLGESVYPLLKEVPEVQIGREDLFSRIAELDEQVAAAEARAAYEQETRRLQELHRRQVQERAQRAQEEQRAQAQQMEQQAFSQCQEPVQQAFAQQTFSQSPASAGYRDFGQQQPAQQQASGFQQETAAGRQQVQGYGQAAERQGGADLQGAAAQQGTGRPQAQEYRCPRCGSPVDQHAPFCGYCGCLFQSPEQG